MTHTALQRRRIAFLRLASGVTIAVRLGDHRSQQPKQKAPLNLMTLAEPLRRFKMVKIQWTVPNRVTPGISFLL